MVNSGSPEWTVTEIGGQDAFRVRELNLLKPIDTKIVDTSMYPAPARDTHAYISSAYSTVVGYRTHVFPNDSQPKE